MDFKTLEKILGVFTKYVNMVHDIKYPPGFVLCSPILFYTLSLKGSRLSFIHILQICFVAIDQYITTPRHNEVQQNTFSITLCCIIF